ncbi:non-ribosomal peptide synthetase [Chryseobacterium nematophagum]|uniref:Non-ribosomal peptide synthetase n=1 Tax=Chryseobacterium nematophagum TaxID=2305228 RepID=A0A3M7TBP8_9FLAO|nr:non-ribosomal peptide synthetase [Chryseobacterium nematophagum]RNA60932.1 non-ribosomal peptide synthetase [Chryseobacterium nematophagum]
MNLESLTKLTPYQSVFYNELALRPSRSDYNIVFTDQSMSGNIDVKRLNSSLIRFINENLLVNSNVVSGPDGLFWKNRGLLGEEDSILSFFSEEPSSEEILQLALMPFDLEKDQLVRFYAIKLDNGKYRIIYIFSHILVDGLSANFLYNELANYYNNSDYVNPISLTEQMQLHHNLNDQFDAILENGKSEMNNFWEEHLVDVESMGFKFLQSSGASPTFDKQEKLINSVSELRFEFCDEVFSKVKKLTRDYKLTPNTYGQLILAILLHRMSGINNLAINYPVGIKEGQDFIFGAHVNTVLKGYYFNPSSTLGDLLDQNIKYVRNLKKNKAAYLPIGELSSSVLKSDILEFGFAQTNLKDVFIQYEGTYDTIINHELNIDLPGKILFEQEIKDGQLNYRVKYDNLELSTELVTNFTEFYKILFIDVLDDLLNKNTHRLISDYNLLNEDMYNKIIHNWNKTNVKYDSLITIHGLFEDQVEKTPENIAIVYDGTYLSYRELNEKANQLAHYLLAEYKIKPDELIPLCLERSEKMLIAILGVLKAGGAYVPTDSGYPDERIDHILIDTDAKIVITEEKVVDRFCSVGLLCDQKIISLDNEEIDSDIELYSKDNPITEISSRNLAYVIYTSGTTGKPKGVMIEHTGVVNLINFMVKSHKFESYKNVGCYSNYVFDAFVCEVFPVLSNGNTLWLYNNELRYSVKDLNEYIKNNNIEVSFIPPVLLKEVISDTSLKLIFAGGENFPDIDRDKTDIFLINEYGPTETTVCATSHHYSEDSNPVNIGRPIDNTSVYVLDKYLRPVPVGVVGELYIGGAGVCRGYVNLPDLTSERFIPNHFQTEEEYLCGYNGRIYKTGDLVRYLPKGGIEYLGRNDFQVKIRGFRIELGEIENVLLQHKDINKAIVLGKTHSTGEKYLVAYYMSEVAVDHDGLSRYLLNSLPDYMVPSAYVHLEDLPITINGKLDTRSLPEPSFSFEKEYIGPQNELQNELVNIWGKILGIAGDKISIQDDFFQLGGNSVMAIKFINEVQYNLGMTLKVRDVFHERTILALSSMMINQTKEYKPIISLNNAEDKPNMFLIHPGGAGCEVYKSLAENLKLDYHCYGVDSYNLYNEEKIDSLSELATYYLKYIETVQEGSDQEEYILLGWSLGGQIALEIASQLEKRGCEKITVYLLDTILYSLDPKLLSFSLLPSDEEISLKYQTPINSDYFFKLKKFLSVELAISKQNISSNLRLSKTVLLKAMLKEENENALLTSYVEQLICNNIDLVIENPSLLDVHPLHISHYSILDKEQQIINIIKERLNWKSTKVFKEKKTLDIVVD